MNEAKFTIATRQKADALFEVSAPLEAAEERELDVRLVLGYAQIMFFGFGDQPFQISVRGSCSENGTFVEVGTLSSEVQGSNNVICERLEFCAPYMKLFVSNPGAAQTIFSLCVHGLPIG